MQPDQAPYAHRAIHGLPASLLALEGRTVAVIALMTRQAGLNRLRRRDMKSGVKVLRTFGDRFDDKIARPEMNVLSYYLNPNTRFGNFWATTRLMREPQGGRGARSYAMAVDIQLLSAYEPSWLGLTLDEQALTASCEEWPHIRVRVEKAVDSKGGDPPLGVFMLWPRIAKELGQFEAMDAHRRLTVGHVVFSLSSIGLTDWFVTKALELCPALGAELRGLLQPPADAATPSAHQSGAEVTASSEHSEAAEVRAAERPDAWTSLIQRLDELTTELTEHPTQEAVSDLGELVRELEAHCVSLPLREQPLARQLDDRIAALLAHLQSLARRDGFQWLDSDLIAQIEARWQLAVQDRIEPEQMGELAADALAAVQRTETASAELEKALTELERSSDEVADAASVLETAKGFAEQAAAKRRRSEAVKQQLEAEARQQARQERLIDAASPFGEPFDYSIDYQALLEVDTPLEIPQGDAPDPSPKTSATTPDTLTVSATTVPGLQTEPSSAIQGLPAEIGSTAAEPETAEASARVFQHALGETLEQTIASEPPANERPHSDEQPSNDAAEDASRPIWQLMMSGQPALAFHAATWIESTHPDVRLPSADLLAAVALEGALMLPDGAVQSAMSARFERLHPADFAAQELKPWHAAVNLLLAAATMRAMIIAPSTGAGTVAAYLHQSGSYPALYALIQQLREFSPLLMGFRIEPAILREARGEAAIRADLHALQRVAEDWLRVQAPAYTIKFAAATNVWRQWLHAGGEIESLVAPIVHNRVGEADRVREQLAAMSDHDHVRRLIHDTDRKRLMRRRGEDIHAGALDHLMRNVDEALQLPRRWIGLVELLGRQGDRMRDLLEQVHARLRESRHDVEEELLRVPEHDPWGLVQAGQAQALRAMHGVIALFDANVDMPSSEPSPNEVLGRPVLLISDLPVRDDWTTDATPDSSMESLVRWAQAPLSAEEAGRRRLERGDVLGAELLVQSGMVDPQTLSIRLDRDRWKQALRKEVAECRRAVEVGSAYGYLVDADRGAFESRLAQWEAQLDDIRRFDLATAEIRAIRAKVDDAREVQASQVREELRQIAPSQEMAGTVAEVEQAIRDGDLATARELVHWLVQGRAVPTDGDGEYQEGFERFFPGAMLAIDSWLEGQRRGAIEQALRQGLAIPGMDAQRVAGAQREQAGNMFGAWSDMKASHGSEQSRLELLMTGLGFTVKSLSRVEKVAGREVWALDTQVVEDRHICPLAMFGSAAAGKYRLVCVWGRPTEDELLQWVGDSTVIRPTFLLYFGRMTERKCRELSRLSKTKRRSFVLLDETLLVHLCHASGSRLRAWLDVSLPFSFSSPYDATAGLVPPEMFYGRGAELDAVRGPKEGLL